MSKYLPAYGRARNLICVAVGHKMVSGIAFMAEDCVIDLKWKACLRCGRWFPENGFEQVEHEIELSVRQRLNERSTR